MVVATMVGMLVEVGCLVWYFSISFVINAFKSFFLLLMLINVFVCIYICVYIFTIMKNVFGFFQLALVLQMWRIGLKSAK